MSEEQAKVKVVDRRRFIQDGENIKENPNAKPDEPSTTSAGADATFSPPEQPAGPQQTAQAPQQAPSQEPAGTQTAKQEPERAPQQPPSQADGAKEDKKEAAEEQKQAAERRADQAAAGLPPADVVTLIEFVAQQVSLYLGEPDPMGRSIQPNLPAAGLFIDLLGVLKEKTKGNLNLEEQHALDQVLTALRLRYVKMRG